MRGFWTLWVFIFHAKVIPYYTKLNQVSRLQNQSIGCNIALIWVNTFYGSICWLECYKKTKHAKFSEKRLFLTPWYAHAHVCVSGVRNVRFFGKFGVLCFLIIPVLRFALLPYKRLNDELFSLAIGALSLPF